MELWLDIWNKIEYIILNIFDKVEICNLVIVFNFQRYCGQGNKAKLLIILFTFRLELLFLIWGR